MSEKETAMVVRTSDPIVAYTPQTPESAWWMAKAYAASRLLGGDLSAPEAVLFVMATGAELGIPPTAALRGIYVIKGKPALSADLMVAMCMRRREVCARFDLVETTAAKCTYRVQRVGGAAIDFTFTMSDAEAAGIVSEMYRKWPAVMLRHRCAAQAARAVFPDIVMGLYTRDEIEGGSDAPEVTPAPVAPITSPPPAPPAPTDWRREIEACRTQAQLDERAAALSATVPREELTAAFKARRSLLRALGEFLSAVGNATTPETREGMRSQARALFVGDDLAAALAAIPEA